MKSWFLICTSAFLFCFSVGKAQDDQQSVFQAGEKLTYLARFGFFYAGRATFFTQHATYEGRKVYHATALAETIGLPDKIYKVRDVYESYMDMETGLPYLSVRNISEGNYRYYNEVRFFHDSLKVVSQRSGQHEVPANILDMVSAFYYLRSVVFNNLEPGDVVVLDTFFSDEIFPLKVRYRGKEIVKTRLGRFSSMKFSPVVEPGRIFDSEDDVTIWISDDKNFIPLHVRVDLIVGSIKCDLITYKGLKHPLKPLD